MKIYILKEYQQHTTSYGYGDISYNESIQDIYTDKGKAEKIKNKFIKKHPNSRFSLIEQETK